MGFEFRTQEERNPVKHPLEDKVTELENEISKLNEFLELIGKAHIYDFWITDGKMPETKEDNYIDYEDIK